MAYNRVAHSYHELSRVEVGENFWIVVSQRNDGKIIIATANVVQAEGRTKTVFLANPLILKNLQSLADMGDCLLDACDRLNPPVEAKVE
jgi:hypothetical protein